MNRPKRVVSIGEYVAHRFRYFTRAGTGLIFLVIGILGWLLGMVAILLFAVRIVIALIFDATRVQDWVFLSLLAMSGTALCFLLNRCGQVLTISAEKMESVVPLTRANADRLPVEDVLVRSSSEPTLPESVLLRAAASGEGEENENELLRASVSEEKGSHPMQRKEHHVSETSR